MVRLTDILEKMGAVNAAQIQTAVQHHQQVNKPVGQCLVAMQACTEDAIVQALSIQLGLRRVRLSDMLVDSRVLAMVPREIATWYNAIPLGVHIDQYGRKVMQVAMSRPQDPKAMEHLKKLTGYEIHPVLAGDAEIAQAIASAYEQTRHPQDGLHTAAMDDWIDLEDE